MAAKHAVAGAYSVRVSSDGEIDSISINSAGDLYLNLSSFGTDFSDCTIFPPRGDCVLHLLIDDGVFGIGNFSMANTGYDFSMIIDVREVTDQDLLDLWYLLDNDVVAHNRANISILDKDSRVWSNVVLARAFSRHPSFTRIPQIVDNREQIIRTIKPRILKAIPNSTQRYDFTAMFDFVRKFLIFVRRANHVDDIKSYLFAVATDAIHIEDPQVSEGMLWTLAYDLGAAIDCFDSDYTRAYYVFMMLDDIDINMKMYHHLKTLAKSYGWASKDWDEGLNLLFWNEERMKTYY